jgi:hypothetical protein
MTSRKATATLSRATLTATATVSPAAKVCASADLFRAPQYLLPPFESSLTAGKTLTVLPEASGTWAVAICKDMDFTALSRQYGHNGVGLIRSLQGGLPPAS